MVVCNRQIARKEARVMGADQAYISDPTRSSARPTRGFSRVERLRRDVGIASYWSGSGVRGYSLDGLCHTKFFASGAEPTTPNRGGFDEDEGAVPQRHPHRRLGESRDEAK